jgi:glucoamylase
MLYTSILRALPAALLFSGAQATPLDLESRQASLDSFVTAQTTVSINGVLANIGGGSKAPGVPAGIVVASPSRSDPDCKFGIHIVELFMTNRHQTGTLGHVMPLSPTRH